MQEYNDNDTSGDSMSHTTINKTEYKEFVMDCNLLEPVTNSIV
jgi:hypothetical protein